MDRDVSVQSIYCNPPWSLAIECVEHLHACHLKLPLNTRAAIVPPGWPKLKTITKDLKSIKQLPKGEKVLTIITPTDTSDPHDLIPFPSVIDY